MSVQQFDHQTQHAGRLAPDAQGGNGVANPSDLIAVRVEDAYA